MSNPRRKFLLVHTGALSHMLMALQAIETLYRGIPDLDIHILTTELGASFFDQYPPIKKVLILTNPKSLSKIVKLMPQIKSEAYLGILYFQAGIKLSFLGRLCKIPIRIGPQGWPIRLFFTHTIKPQEYLHQSEAYLKFLDPLDIDLAVKDLQLQRYFPTNAATPKWISKHLAPGKKTLCLFLDETIKQWQESFDYLIEKVVEKGEFNIIVCGNKPTTLSQHASILNVTGKLGLSKLIEVLSYSEYVISPNMAIIQLASILQKPLVVLIPNTPFFTKKFGPQTPYFVLLPQVKLAAEDLFKAFESLENSVQFQDPLSIRRQKALLSLASYKVLYITRNEALSLPEYRAIVDFKQQGLDILPISLQAWDFKGILKTVKHEKITILQGEVPRLFVWFMRLFGNLYLHYKPLILRQKFHRYIRLKEYLAMYQSVENRVK